MAHLFIQFAICAGMTAGLAVFHLVGLMSLLHLARFHLEHWKCGWAWADRVAVPLTMILALFVVHGLEIWAYALLYILLGGTDLEPALYAAAIAYTTVGMEHLPSLAPWRLVVAHEALVGFLMIGWSTAFLFSALNRILTTDRSHPLPEGAIARDTSTDD